MKPKKKTVRRRKSRRRSIPADGVVSIDELVSERVEGVLRPVEAAAFAQIAAVLAGDGASDSQVMAQFGRAWLIAQSARRWLDEDDAGRSADLNKYLAGQAASFDPCLPWSDPQLHAATGYASRARDPVETGKLLRGAMDERIRRRLPKDSLQRFRERYKKGIPLRLLTELWAATARVSGKGQTSSVSG